jgi:hypothetical protein
MSIKMFIHLAFTFGSMADYGGDGWATLAEAYTITPDQIYPEVVATAFHQADQAPVDAAELASSMPDDIVEEAIDADGWAEVVQHSLATNAETLRQQVLASGAAITNATSNKKKRGRPPGSTGSHAVRSQMREAEQAAAAALFAATPAAAASETDTTFLTSKAKKVMAMAAARDKRWVRSSSPESSLDVTGSSSDPTLQDGLAICQFRRMHFSNIGSFMQKELILAALNNRQLACDADVEEELAADSIIAQSLLNSSCHRASSSFAAKSDALGVSRSAVSRGLIRTGSAFLALGGMLWGSLFAMIAEAFEEGRGTPLLFIKQMRYDETPTKIRLQEDGQVMQDNKMKPENITYKTAKILQTEFRVSALLKNTADNKYSFLTGRVPTHLSCVDRTTAEATVAAIHDAQSGVPELTRVANLFPLKVQLSVTDRYGANGAAESAISYEDATWTKVHVPCDVRKVSTAQTKQFQLVDGHISSIISCGLSMQEAGSRAAFQHSLFEEITQRLEIVDDMPPGGAIQENRHAIYDLFLSVGKGGDHKSKLSKFKRYRWQRVILDHYLNGDLSSKRVKYYLGLRDKSLPSTLPDILEEFRQFVIPALVPKSCPIFPRSRWTNSDESVDWNGLLLAHHGLYEPAYLRFCSINKKKPKPSASTSVVASSTASGWDFVCEEVAAPLQQPAQDPVETNGLGPGPGNADADEVQGQGDARPADVQEPANCFDWAAFNEKLREQCSDWVQTQPFPVVVIMRIAMSPVLYVMNKFLQTSGTGWDKEQQARVAAGQPRSYRFIEAHLGTVLQKAFQMLFDLLHQAPKALSQTTGTRMLKVLLFRMLARAGCALHQLLEMAHETYPYKMFGALRNPAGAAKIFHDLPCLFEELANSFTKLYPTVDDIMGTDAQAVLEGIALVGDVDIAAIERRHASTRRILCLSSLQTWAASLEYVSADWACRQYVLEGSDLAAQMAPPVNPTAASSAAGNKNRKHKKAGGGGAWRAFVHMKCQDGCRVSGDQFSELSRQYRSLTPEEKAKYSELGKIGTLSRKRGYPAFAASKRRRLLRQPVGLRSLADFSQDATTALDVMDVGNMDAMALATNVFGACGIEDKLEIVRATAVQERADIAARQHLHDVEVAAVSNAVMAAPDLVHKHVTTADSLLNRGWFPCLAPLPARVWSPPIYEVLEARGWKKTSRQTNKHNTHTRVVISRFVIPHDESKTGNDFL